jgi:hypothetical protein
MMMPVVLAKDSVVHTHHSETEVQRDLRHPAAGTKKKQRLQLTIEDWHYERPKLPTHPMHNSKLSPNKEQDEDENERHGKWVDVNQLLQESLSTRNKAETEEFFRSFQSLRVPELMLEPKETERTQKKPPPPKQAGGKPTIDNQAVVKEDPRVTVAMKQYIKKVMGNTKPLKRPSVKAPGPSKPLSVGTPSFGANGPVHGFFSS